MTEEMHPTKSKKTGRVFLNHPPTYGWVHISAYKRLEDGRRLQPTPIAGDVVK